MVIFSSCSLLLQKWKLSINLIDLRFLVKLRRLSQASKVKAHIMYRLCRTIGSQSKSANLKVVTHRDGFFYFQTNSITYQSISIVDSKIFNNINGFRYPMIICILGSLICFLFWLSIFEQNVFFKNNSVTL